KEGVPVLAERQPNSFSQVASAVAFKRSCKRKENEAFEHSAETIGACCKPHEKSDVGLELGGLGEPRAIFGMPP
ncbi:hypothetical protein CT0861_13267, partial [Colletotrichum tofieldiae]